MVATEPVLQYCLMHLSSNASKDDLGAVIVQLHNDKCLTIAYASRGMTSTNTYYAQLEKELLGIVFACERFHQYIFVATVEAETDHKPLISMFKEPLNDCPLRVQRLLLRVQRYDLAVIYTPGKQLAVADALSRAPNHEADAGEVAQIKGLEAYVGMIVRTMPMSDGRLVEIRQATLAD